MKPYGKRQPRTKFNKHVKAMRYNGMTSRVSTTHIPRSARAAPTFTAGNT